MPHGQMYRKAKQALNALNKAHAHLIAAHSRQDEDGVPQPQPVPWFEGIEKAVADEIEKLESAIAGGGPRRGAPRKDEFVALVKELADIYTKVTGKKPKSTRSSPKYSRTSCRPEFHRFVIACLRNVDPHKARLPTIDASIFAALHS
ncbi:MAG: hypothetical protein RLN70_07525 [Rhodospirillaceae bacterium]